MSTSALATVAELHALALGPEATADIDPADLESQLLAATSVVYSYLSRRYALPLVTWGQDVRLAVCRIAAFYILSRRGFDPSNPADQVIIKGHDDSIAWLRDVSNGRAGADVVDTAPAARTAPRAISRPVMGW